MLDFSFSHSAKLEAQGKNILKVVPIIYYFLSKHLVAQNYDKLVWLFQVHLVLESICVCHVNYRFVGSDRSGAGAGWL